LNLPVERLKEEERFQMIRRSIFAALLMMVASGCSFGRFALSLNQEHKVPFPEVTMLPEQWEPESSAD